MNWSGAAGFKIYYYRLALNSSATIKGYAIGEAIANDHYFFDPKNPNDPRTNLSSKNPRLTNNSGNDQSGMTQSSVHLQKGDYIKLKNLTIGYTLPAVLSKKYMHRISVSLLPVKIYLPLPGMTEWTRKCVPQWDILL